MLLEVDLEKRFPGFGSRVKFTLTSSRCGVFGPSGSGKSTLMNMLAGLVDPDRGFIRLNGKTLFDSDRKINLPPEKRKVGVVFQHAHLFPHMNVRKNLYYGMKRRRSGGGDIDPGQLIAVLQLERLLDRRVTRLSGGEKQRVALGRTILACPDLILMDEPLTGLDGQLKYQIIPHLQRVFNEFSIPILFISHSLHEMRMMTDDVLVMHEGAVARQLTTEELARAEACTTGGGYINLLELDVDRDHGDLLSYRWGEVELMVVKSHAAPEGGRFSLSSRDILLFKKHPEAASARNMLACTVRNTYTTEWLVGVELDCRGNSLIAEIVPQSVHELDIRPGAEVVAVMKASAINRLY
ncbi:molybdenum ABC transporter ATP-binding protein [Desulforhopalus singaporensis]|uniref:Molybdate transport system ATP-binding protein n=1 Tax=Desulforhopalus singaporensis TaxID=91360 RepID=A0A1H0KLX9_9BACT|nr:molybdenum ABC transporter ATP-binding protein [Desulforhopalus singaporensis]SDO56967.1 molybdate transport system ATP-binding protein [Desulforhopalus singaporensis]